MIRRAATKTSPVWLESLLESRPFASSWIRAGLGELKRLTIGVETPSRFSENLRDFSRAIGLGAAAQLSERKPLHGEVAPDGAIKIIDMFSGCGGMSLGFEAVSRLIPTFSVSGSLDISRAANLTFQSNFGVRPSDEDICELNRSSEKLREFLQQCDVRPCKDTLVLVGCAPCQGFTSHRKKQWHRVDHRNSLIKEFAEVAKRIEPDVVVMENVPEMLSRRYWADFESARNVLKSAGYHVRQAIYNCAEFGVPQERFRALVMAMKRPFAMPSGFLKPEEYLTVREAIGGLPPLTPGKPNPTDPLHVTANHRRETLERIKRVPRNGGSRQSGVGPKCLDRVRGFYDVYGRLAWDKPAITVTHYSRNPASGRYVHPVQHRGLSVREAALLQTFPLGFVFEGTFDEKFSQIGNAVPPP